MPLREPDFTLGIEEEYLLVDPDSRDLVIDPPTEVLAECQRLSESQVSPEYLRSQIEVGTRVCRNIGEAREDLARLRRLVGEVSASAGMAPIAASTHPFALWTDQRPSDVQRYSDLSLELQAAAQRLLVCGMHVHVGIDDDELRIDLMNQLRYFLPHLLALSTSSPFWEGRDTGLRSYRLTILDALPRTGIPESFESFPEYHRHLDVLIQAGLLEDATKIWWDVRPSARYPTLEVRIFDVCTSLDDAVALAALTACLLRRLYRLRRDNQRWRIYGHLLLMENRWRAMRYGMDEGLLDLAKGEIVDVPQLVDEIIELVGDDAEALGCEVEITHVRDILTRGTSAHRQVARYQEVMEQGGSDREALRAVVDFLIEETTTDLS